MRSIVARFIGTVVLAMSAATAVVWACGPEMWDLPTVSVLEPADRAAFLRGEVGVVRPRLYRANLAIAYRALAGLPPLLSAPAPAPTNTAARIYPQEEWRRRRAGAIGAAPLARDGRQRRLHNYALTVNCADDAYITAARTFDDRSQRFGAASPQLRDWVVAQDVVFSNCDSTPVALPEPAAADADALTRADRAYQTAAAYFYGMQHDEAIRRFRDIGDDPASPWRPYGRYLAARALIRKATLPDEPPPGALEEAERAMQAVIADPIAAPVHDSARGLLTFVRVRMRPVEELRAVAARLTANRLADDDQAFVDFTYLMDRAVGDTINFAYDDDAAAGREAHDLADWVLAFQGQNAAARARAFARWDQTRSLPWLVAALWHLDAGAPLAAPLLQAAAAVPSSSPAYVTVTFLRIRALLFLGRADDARRLLGTLPEEPGPGFSVETINLLRAGRLATARDLEEFLENAPRGSVPLPAYAYGDLQSMVTFDADAAAILNERLPLDRLVDAALSTTLPDRLRARVATVAFTRAVLLDRHDAARRVVPALRATVPLLAGDLDRYERAAAPDQQRWAATLLILRTPGMTGEVRRDDSYSSQFVEPRRQHESFVTSWWCGPYSGVAPAAAGEARSELVHLLYPSHNIPYPSFVDGEARTATETERSARLAVGHGAPALAQWTLAWVRQHPSDPDAAEALSRIVNGWRRSCREDKDATLAQQAFRELHRRYPSSTWAKQTRYWYR